MECRAQDGGDDTPLLTLSNTAKATDENLTSEDWAAIMEVCDRVSGDSNGSQQSVQALIKRLAHRNANVQLYTLEVSKPWSLASLREMIPS